MSLTLLDGLPGLIAPALVAGLLVASTHVPLGREVLRRGIIFLDLAVAQIAGLGVVAASVFFGWDGLGAQCVAFVCALAAAVLFSALERKGQMLQEAYIGCAFVVSASLAILIFAGDPHGGEEISDLLAGQILWVSWRDILLMACVYIPVLGILNFNPAFAQKYFYLFFAACITLSVQMVGVYLVFASLILPALASSTRSIWYGYGMAGFAVTGGLILSVLSDLPSGPLLVCVYAGLAMLMSLLLRTTSGKAG